jgi:hypothetical protein
MIWNVAQGILDSVTGITAQFNNTDDIENFTLSSSESGTVINNTNPSNYTTGIPPRVDGVAGDNTRDDAITVFSDKDFEVWGLFTGTGQLWMKLDDVDVSDPEYKGYVTLLWADKESTTTHGIHIAYYFKSKLNSQDLTNGEVHDIYIAKHPNNSTTDLKTGNNLIIDYKFDGDVNDHRVISLKGSRLVDNKVFIRTGIGGSEGIEPIDKKMSIFEVDVDLSGYAPGDEFTYTIPETKRIKNAFFMADGFKSLEGTLSETVINGSEYVTVISSTMLEDQNQETRWKLYYKLK